MLWSRRTLFMALVIGLPVLLALIVRGLVAMGVPLPHVDRGEVTGPLIFGLMVWAFFVRFSVPVLALFYGTSLIADEVEDKTITYLFVRPIPREAIVLGKYLAYLVATVFVVLPGLVLVWILIASIGSSLGATVFDLAKDLGVLAIGLAVYGAVFAWVGATVRRPLVVGLVFVFGWEVIGLALPGSLKLLTVAYYLQGLVPQAMPADTTAIALIQAAFRDTPSVSMSLEALALIAVVSLWLTARTVAHREYVLDQ
jgi:ABC-type transport system involved in multi-copper enzyme maturation permease subunit